MGETIKNGSSLQDLTKSLTQQIPGNVSMFRAVISPMVINCNGRNNQKWVFAPGSYKVTYAANSRKCVDVPGGDFSNGNQLQWEKQSKMGLRSRILQSHLR